MEAKDESAENCFTSAFCFGVVFRYFGGLVASVRYLNVQEV